jgi:hypothetical protein
MPSLNLDLDFLQHPKTERLVGALGDNAELIPLRVWCYVGKFHSKDGVLRGYSKERIETIAKWRGRPGEAVDALVEVRFLDWDGTNYRVHNWKKRSGHIYLFKKRAEKASKARWTSNATSIPKTNVKQSPCMALHGINPPTPRKRGAREGRMSAADQKKAAIAAAGSSNGER